MGRDVGSRLVYVIGVEDCPVKIGIADGIRSRLSQLQIGCPDLLRVHHVSKVPFPLAEVIETRAHKVFADRHRRGEWFNVDRREAAEVIEGMKAELLVEWRWKARLGDGDLLTRLAASYELKRDAREAVWDYRERLERGDDYCQHANGFILKRAGMASYAAFSLVIAQRKSFLALSAKETDKAEAALVKALNALSDFRAAYAKKMALAAYGREIHRLADPHAKLRPPSLPPVKAA